MIPSVDQCFRFMDQYEMLSNIRAHSMVVARVAELITRGLSAVGIAVPLDLVVAGALMHDIGKTACLGNDRQHAREGEEICVSLGLHELTDIVAEHVILKNGWSDQAISAKEIVYYSDKRVRHDEVVGLYDRLEYILERYGQNNEWLKQKIRENFKICLALEKGLFSKLSFQPEDVAGLVNGRAGGHEFMVALESS